MAGFSGTTHVSAFQGLPEEQFYHIYHSPVFAALTLTNGNYPAFVLPAQADIVKITYRLGTVGTDSGDQITWFKAAPGTALSVGATGTPISYTIELNGGSAAYPIDVPFLSGTAHHNLAAGTQIGFVTAGTISGVADFQYDIVYRTGPFYRADGSGGAGTGNIIQGKR